MKKTQVRKPLSTQGKHSSSEEAVRIAKVPIKVTIEHGDAVLKKYEDVIDVEFTDKTEEGKSNIASALYLREVKGVSTDEAIFLIASKAHEEFAKEFAATLSISSPVELHVRIKRNGDISYGMLVS